jgi:hypothetical protein
LKKKKLKKPKENNLKNFFIATLLVFGLAGCEDPTTGETQPTDEKGVSFTGASDNTGTTGATTTTGTTTTVEETVTTPVEETTPTEETTPVEETTPAEETTPEETTEETTTTELEGEVTMDDLTAQELADIEILRDNIFEGLDVGKGLYIQQVSLALEDLGLFDGSVDLGNVDVVLPEVSSCPFVEYYNNEKPLSEASCEYLVDQARSDAYSKLASALQTNRANFNSELSELDFWYEQGAISGLEEARVIIQVQLKTEQLCNKTPTSKESSYEKGLVTGRQHFTNTMNNWLATNGHKADYPVMSEPIEVCSANASVLDPVYDDAINTISQAMVQNPLCSDYEPTNTDDTLRYGQAQADFTKAFEQGVDDEFALAAVKIFKVVPCNVSDPIIIDLNGNGQFDVTPIYAGVNFKITGNRPQAMSWVSGDGFLFYDANKNGIADNGLELLGTDTDSKSGFDQLSWFDTNKDKVFDSKDKQFSSFFVWNDMNSNGVCERTEVTTLGSVNITSIPLTTKVTNKNVNGNLVKATTQATTTGKTTMLVGDVDLRSAAYPRL